MQIDTGVDDPDGDAAAVPGRMGREERRRLRLADRHIRVVFRGTRTRSGLRLRRLARVG